MSNERVLNLIGIRFEVVKNIMLPSASRKIEGTRSVFGESTM